MRILKLPFVGEVYWRRRSRLRYVEEKRQVPVACVGPFCITFWPKQVVEREHRYHDRA